MTTQLQAGAFETGPVGTDVLPAGDEPATRSPLFIVRRPMAHGFLWMGADRDGERGWTHVKLHALKLTEDEAEIVVHQFNKYSNEELEIVGAGRAEP